MSEIILFVLLVVGFVMLFASVRSFATVRGQPRFLHLVRDDETTVAIIDLEDVIQVFQDDIDGVLRLNFKSMSMPQAYTNVKTAHAIVHAVKMYRKQQGLM